MISRKKKYSVWGVYLLLAPALYYIVFTFARRVESIFSIEFILFTSLGILVALFPIRTENSILFLLNGISLATLVIFGLHAEMIISSIALIALMTNSNIKWDDHYRYPMNFLMFHIVSIISASAYYSVELYIAQSNAYNVSILAVITYLVVNLLTNQFIIHGIDHYFYKRKERTLFDKDFNFSFYACLFIAPLSFILIYLYYELSLIGIVIGSLPFVTMTIGMNMFYKSSENNNYLQKVNLFSQELSEKKTKNEVVDTYLNSLTTIFPADALSYFSVLKSAEIKRERTFQKETGVKKVDEIINLTNHSALKESIDSSDVMFFNRASDWKENEEFDSSEYAESALLLPIKHQETVVGLILLSHQTKNMYTDMLVYLVKLFHQYFSIALDNAHQYELLEENTETDYLTGLPNLKGFSKRLESVLNESSYDAVSLIVLDLDHFKTTNDTYGHQAGNEVLKQIADLLDTVTDDEISVARYGGEEFIILLPNYSKEEGKEFAEHIRVAIEETSFIIRKSINSNKISSVSVTASLGVATYPTDCTDADELITLADRAMYIGSKQKGRNRVTVARTGSRQHV